jgi:hypothetical protein
MDGYKDGAREMQKYMNGKKKISGDRYISLHHFLKLPFS